MPYPMATCVSRSFVAASRMIGDASLKMRWHVRRMANDVVEEIRVTLRPWSSCWKNDIMADSDEIIVD